MKEAEPFAAWPDGVVVPVGATTIELTNEEVSEALAMYIGRERGENFPGYAVTQVLAAGGRLTIRVTYWPLEREEETK